VTGIHSGPRAAPPASGEALDRQDEWLRRIRRGAWRGRRSRERIRSGDLGVVPVVAGLVVIWTVFQVRNPIFLPPADLVNLAMESVTDGAGARRGGGPGRDGKAQPRVARTGVTGPHSWMGGGGDHEGGHRPRDVSECFGHPGSERTERANTAVRAMENAIRTILRH
jgi:hypothetical protein